MTHDPLPHFKLGIRGLPNDVAALPLPSLCHLVAILVSIFIGMDISAP